MAPPKKLTTPATLFAAIEQDQHDALRRLAFTERRSIADVTRDAIDDYIARRKRFKSEGRRRKTRA